MTSFKHSMNMSSSSSHLPPDHQWEEDSLAHAVSSCSPTAAHLRRLHARAVAFGLASVHLSAALIARYFSFHDLPAALRLFHSLRPKPTETLLWNSVIRGCLTHGRPKLAVDLYRNMAASSVPDHHTYHLTITACTRLGDFGAAREVAEDARESGYQSDLLLGTSLVDFYCKCGDLGSAREVFDGMPVRDSVTWNTLIGGYSRRGLVPEALGLFRTMICAGGMEPTDATFSIMTSACGETGLMNLGEVLHGHVLRRGFDTTVFMSNSLIKMYVDFGLLGCAGRLFSGMRIKDNVSWSTIIGGYVRHGYSDLALKIFHTMVYRMGLHPSRPVLLGVLHACADMGELNVGKFVERKYLGSVWAKCGADPRLATALVYMYAKCGLVNEALRILVGTPIISNDVVAWNAVIQACSKVGQTTVAADIALDMRRRSICPDAASFLTLLSLFANAPSLKIGMELHACIVKGALDLDTAVSNALIDVYAKSGSMKDSYKVFNGIQVKNEISWSTIIKGYAWNGDAVKALSLFHWMRHTGIKPNNITFLAALTACSHAGYVEAGRELFNCMRQDYDLEPSVEIYACMIDLLCRAGLLKEVQGLLEDSCFDNRSRIFLWSSLLNACRIYGNQVVGEVAARQLFMLEPEDFGNYKALAEIYSVSGRREYASTIRSLREESGDLNTAFSWLEVG